MNFFIIFAILSCFVMLVYYGYKDIKFREINIIPLLLFCFLSVIYFAVFILKNNILLWKLYIFQIFVSLIFVGMIFVLGKLSDFAYIGEGDLYIIIMIAFSCNLGIIFPQLVFLGALFVMLLVPVGLFIFNLINSNFPKYGFFKSFLLMILGIPLKINKINNFYTPLEEFSISEGELIRKIKLKPNCEPEKELKLIKDIAKSKNISKIWVSPLIPFIIPILISFVIVVILSFMNVFAIFGSFMIPL